ncbi:hypothetical protein [Microbacterium maritypicum]
MELFGGLPLPFSLALLALIDGLSVGTLLIPVFLLLHPGRVHARRILLYLGTIAAFYLLVGLLFLWGLVNLVDVASDFLASPAGLIIRLLVGGALLITAFVMPTGDKSAAAASLSASLPASASVLPGTGLPTAHEASGSSITTPPPAPAAVAEPRARAGRITRWRERLLDPRTRGTAVMAVAVAAGLVVMSREVVESADGWGSDGGVVPVMIVEVHPGG